MCWQTFSHGYDALKERPDGTYLKVLPGYERPQCGPTTNFVGNHMTQVLPSRCSEGFLQADF